eukprot:g41034.t1
MIYKHHLPADVSILLFSSTEHIQLWDGDDLGELLLLTSLAKLSQKKAFTPGSKRHRMDWETRVASLSDRRFTRRYRVTKEQFDTLLSRLLPELEVACAKAHSYASVAPELQLSMTLRFLAGGSYLDIADLHGVGESTFYKCLWRIILLLNRDSLLGDFMKFPDESEFESLAAGWQSLSSVPHIFDGCLLAIDGIIFKIPCPQPHEVPNPIKCFCRKGYFGINAQLACGPDLRFRWADVRCAGSTHDQLAYTVSGLDNMLKRLHLKYYLVGDNGYIPHEYLLVPYKGKFIRRIDPYKDSFNFHLSQLRIHVERAFGMLTARWGILWKPITTSFAGTLAADEYGRLIDDFEVQDLLTANPASSARNPLCLRREAMVAQLRVEEILRPNTTSENRNKRRRLNFVDEN